MGSATQTVGEAITAAADRLADAGSESPRLDAEVLLGNVLGVDRSGLIAYPMAPLGSGQVQRFEWYVERRSKGEPVAYIRGIKEFYGVALMVDPRVLIPRPETETLVTLAIERIRHELTTTPRPTDSEPYLVWDVGTGSGAIPIAIAAELRRHRYGDAVRFHLSDVSDDALDVAKLNAASQGVADLMSFAAGDLAEAGPTPNRSADLLVANLPYIPSESMPELPVGISFEPATALDGGPDGLGLIRRLLLSLDEVVAQRGMVLLEIGSDQGEAIESEMARTSPGWSSTVHADLSGRPRIVELQRSDG